jgi:hypothetical protein
MKTHIAKTSRVNGAARPRFARLNHAVPVSKFPDRFIISPFFGGIPFSARRVI